MTEVIHLKGVELEDFINYKKPSMFLGTCHCDLKCCREKGYDFSVCQNSVILDQKMKVIPILNLYTSYKLNDITKAVVFGGLEPLLQIDEILAFVEFFRNHNCMDDIVIYTGYTEEEVLNNDDWSKLLKYNNIVMKYGRFVLGDNPHYDEVLGVNLASDNQYAKRY